MMKGTVKFFALLLCVALLAGALTACTQKGDDDTGLYSDSYVERTTNKIEKKYGVHPQVKMVVTVDGEEAGEFTIELYPDLAPETCENFMKLVKKGFYNGLKFHRIVDNFMIQGGDPNGDGTGGTTPTIRGEFSANGFDNKISHTRGVVSMARKSGDMNSASCQFFICYSDMYKDDLDGQYAAFGKVIDGMLFLDTLADLECEMGSDGRLSKPLKDVVIKSAELFNISKGESNVVL